MGVYGAIPTRTKPSLPVCHKLVSHRIFREQVADATAVRNLLSPTPPRISETALRNVAIGTGAALLPPGMGPRVVAPH